MLKSITPETLRGEGRVYGGKLYKMEPKELVTYPSTESIPLLGFFCSNKLVSRHCGEAQLTS
jgi:hypothetical protein